MLLTKNGFYLFYIRRATFLVQNQYYITEYFSFFPCAMALNKIIKSILIEGHVISSEPLQKWFITVGGKKKKTSFRKTENWKSGLYNHHVGNIIQTILPPVCKCIFQIKEGKH